jgi:hypothetical protein
MLLEDPSVETYEKQKHENKSYFSWLFDVKNNLII